MFKSNLAARIFTCVVGIPALFALIFLLPQYNFIGLSIFIFILSFFGSLEMSRLLFKKVVPAAYLVWILPVVEYFMSSVTGFTLITILSFLMFLQVILGEKDDFKNSLTEASKYVLLTVYPSYFLSFVVRLLSLEHVSSYAIVLFLALVFSNDIFAYVFGMLFGKYTAHPFKASPKKSVAGFIGGFICTIAVSVVYCFLLSDKVSCPSVVDSVFLGIGMSVFANMGDLLESVFKRSAGVKDSGNVIPGRGGILDCIDSVIFSAPFFYLMYAGFTA
ncbi:MAG: phosphatidate cytidylyltransferase [Sphaerochaetaceae bacterium]|nr:phosphatidate cytidylyltransferase [Sphaerochaetaceae bacterium]